MERFRRSLLVSLSLLWGCSAWTAPASNPMLERLEGRGPLALREDNRYLASNLLLAHELERSAELRGFVEQRGAPAALEVQESWFSAPVVVLYYLEPAERYEVETHGEARVIRGPFEIPEQKRAELTRAARSVPAPAADAATERGPSHGRSAQNAPSIAASGSFQSIAPTPTPPPSARERLLALIDQSPDFLAEVAPKGDLVHYVTSSRETLRAIALWYTLEEANAGRLARINQLKDPSTLSAGDTIVIPSYLVRNKKRLTESLLDKIAEISR